MVTPKSSFSFGLGLVVVLCTVSSSWCSAQTYDFKATHVAVGAEAGSQVVVDMIVHNTTQDSLARGLGMSMTHDPEYLEVVSVGMFEIGLYNAEFPRTTSIGWASGVIFGGHGGVVVDFGEPQRAIRVTYAVVGDHPLGTVIPLTWETHGSPPVENSVAVAFPDFVTPTLINGSITSAPTSCVATSTMMATSVSLMSYSCRTICSSVAPQRTAPKRWTSTLTDLSISLIF